MKFAPHPYQQRAIQWAMDRPRCALWLEPGLGKTAITLAVIRALYDDFAINRVLIVAPLRVVLNTWPTEIAKWRVGLDYSLITGDVASRKRAAASEAPIHLTNYENLPWLLEHLQGLPYNLLVLDESSKMKAHNTVRFRALRKHIRTVARVLELTGSPAPNGLHDLWAQMALLDPNVLCRNITLFRSTYFTSDYMGYRYTPKPGADALIHARLADLCLSMRTADYLDLPERVYNQIPVSLGRSQMARYRQLERDMVLQLAGTVISAANAAVLTGKCLQYANGQLYREDGGWEAVHAEKLTALEDLVDELSDNLLVAYSYQSDLERLRERFPDAVVLDRDPETVARWNRGEIHMLLAHPASAGHGLNLQAGGCTVCWFGLNWSLELYQQFNARLHRQGQTRPVFVHHLIASGTIDERVLDVLQGKATVQEALMTALKRAA